MWLEGDSRYLKGLFANYVRCFKSLGNVKRRGLSHIRFFHLNLNLKKMFLNSTSRRHPLKEVELHSFLTQPLDRCEERTPVPTEYDPTCASDPVWKFLLKGKLLFVWQDYGASCRSPIYAGFICDTEKQYIVDVHNSLRRRVAKGLETRGNPGPQPPAANMRKLVSEMSLAVNKLLVI